MRIFSSPLLHLASFLVVAACQAQDVSFSIPSFNTSIVDLTGNASTNSLDPFLSLTESKAVIDLNYSGGRAFYTELVPMCDSASNTTASFNTSFVFVIRLADIAGSRSGDGLTFVITRDGLSNSVPDPSVNGGGGYLALSSNKTDGNSSNHFVAVEFDTFMNAGWDPGNDNHVGIDVNGVRSLNTSNLTDFDINLTGGQNISAWIDYDGKAELLQVYVANSTHEKPLGSPVLTSYNVSLCDVLADEHAYVGFTAATGPNSEIHYVKSWNFSTSGLPKNSSKAAAKNRSKTAAIAAGILVPIILIASVFIGCGLKYKGRRRYQRSSHASSDIKSKIELSAVAFGPQKFNHRELCVATRNFSPQQLLGKGGFGNVYKALLNDGSVVAVKRVSKDSRQGEREFVAEVNTIGRLRHRNLVRLLGWCHHREELLLVYEYLPEGSLAKLLFEQKQVILSWDQRHKIVSGLASALCYLHYDWEKQVIHRDVKASNVMLDSEFEARLGDFGLARLAERNKDPETTIVAGTPGYMAPEYSQTGKATTESDVFSFGAVALEVASGRRPIDRKVEVGLVDWVWDLHRQGRLLEAADPAMKGVFDERGMARLLIVGLACFHPQPTMRPNMRQVLQILLEEAPLPSIPTAKPAAFYGSARPHSVDDILSSSASFTSSTISNTFSSSVHSLQFCGR